MAISLQTRKPVKRSTPEAVPDVIDVMEPKSKSTPGMPVKRSRGLGLMPIPSPKPMAKRPRNILFDSPSLSQPSTSRAAINKFRFKTPQKSLKESEVEDEFIQDEIIQDEFVQDEFVQDENVCTQEPRKIVVTHPASAESSQKVVRSDDKENQDPTLAPNQQNSTLDKLLFVLNREQDLNEMRLKIMNKVADRLK